jgi:hypothetical protein
MMQPPSLTERGSMYCCAMLTEDLPLGEDLPLCVTITNMWRMFWETMVERRQIEHPLAVTRKHITIKLDIQIEHVNSIRLYRYDVITSSTVHEASSRNRLPADCWLGTESENRMDRDEFY